MNSLRVRGAVALAAAAAFVVATVGQPTRAHAGNYGGAIAAGIIGGAVLGIIASQVAKSHKSASAPQHHHVRRTRKAKAKVKAPAPAKQETQAQVVRQAPPPMKSDPFKGVVPAVVPASSVTPASF